MPKEAETNYLFIFFFGLNLKMILIFSAVFATSFHNFTADVTFDAVVNVWDVLGPPN